MAGEKSKKLMFEIREDLRDHERAIVRANSTIYGKLTHYEAHIMENYQTKKEKAEIDLVKDTAEYDIPAKFMEITGFSFNDDIAVFPIVDFDNTTGARKVILSNSDTFKTGDKMTLEGYVKPLSTHVISESEDPVIISDFYYLLKELVLSDYRHIRQDFRDKESVEKDIKKKAMALKRTNRAYPNNPFGSLQF